jgi:protein lin-37
VKQEPVEKANLIKALEENLKAVVETQGGDTDEDEEHIDPEEQENDPEEDEEHVEDEEAEDEEEEPPVKIKKEPRGTKTIKQHIQSQNYTPQAASYIMKLFDRSVNLAQFEEDTPLYPLCRAWMKNQPRAIVRSEPVTDPVDVQQVEDGDIVEMPRVRIRKGKTPARSEVRINKKDFDKGLQIDTELWTKEKLLDDHRAHWQAEKLRHIQSSQAFEEKHFAANLELLESLI